MMLREEKINQTIYYQIWVGCWVSLLNRVTHDGPGHIILVVISLTLTAKRAIDSVVAQAPVLDLQRLSTVVYASVYK